MAKPGNYQTVFLKGHTPKAHLDFSEQQPPPRRATALVFARPAGKYGGVNVARTICDDDSATDNRFKERFGQPPLQKLRERDLDVHDSAGSANVDDTMGNCAPEHGHPLFRNLESPAGKRVFQLTADQEVDLYRSVMMIGSPKAPRRVRFDNVRPVVGHEVGISVFKVFLFRHRFLPGAVPGLQWRLAGPRIPKKQSGATIAEWDATQEPGIQPQNPGRTDRLARHRNRGRGLRRALRRLVRSSRPSNRGILQAIPDLPLFLAPSALLPRRADAMLAFILFAGILVLLPMGRPLSGGEGQGDRHVASGLRRTPEAVGDSNKRILFRHIVPNMSSYRIV